jgi:uncharacterized protein (TIRG00374 family)
MPRPVVLVDAAVPEPTLQAQSEPPAASPSAPVPTGLGGWLRRHVGKIIVSIGIGACLAWLLARGGLPFVPERSWFVDVRPGPIAAYMGLLIAAHVLRSVRWRHLLRPVGNVPLRSVVGVTWISLAAIVLAPFRTGEVVRPYLISKRGTVRVWEAASTIAAERVLDGLSLTFMLFVGLALAPPRAPLPARVGDLPVSIGAVRGAAYGALALFTSAFAMMALFYWRRQLARKIVHTLVGIVSPRLADRVASIVERLAEGLRFLPSGRTMAPFLAETAGYWAASVIGLWLLGMGAGLQGFSIAEACVTLGVASIGVLLPAAPGFFGAFQLSTYMALAMFYPEATIRSTGAAFVFLFYVTSIGWHLVAAGLGWLIDRPPHAATAH